MTIKHYNKLRKNQGEGISLRSSSNGKVLTLTLPVDNNPPVFGSSSGFLPINAISCYGCDKINSSNGCYGFFEEFNF